MLKVAPRDRIGPVGRFSENIINKSISTMVHFLCICKVPTPAEVSVRLGRRTCKLLLPLPLLVYN